MGKKSGKKKQQKEWVRKSPDEVFDYGPLKFERFGQYIRMSNVSTPEQHAEFLVNCRDANSQILKDIERDLKALQETVAKYDSVELMHRAAYMLLPLLMKYKSEYEFGVDESYCLPTVEYIQYLIARTQMTENGAKPSEEEWDDIWKKATNILRLTQSHLTMRGTLTTPPTGMDELRLCLDFRRLAVRVKRYPIFFATYLRDSLLPYEQWIKERHQIGTEEIIAGLEKISEYQKIGVAGRIGDVINLQQTFFERLIESGHSVDPNASEEEVQRTKEVLVSEKYHEILAEIQEKSRLAFTPAIFEITNLTVLPKPFLSFLSIKPGESVLTELTGPNHDDLSPLSTSILHYKPFMEVNDRFYTFYHSGFDDRIAEIIEGDLFEKFPEKIPVMAKKRSDRLESNSAELFDAILSPDFSFQNAYYPNPDDPGQQTELDILIGVGDILFLVEAKAGGFSAGASRGSPKSIARELSELIIEGQRQSERAEKYIRSNAEVPFFYESGKKGLCKIKHSDYRKIFRIIITREALGWVGAKIATLSILDANLSKAYPWHVSIDDMKIVSELFRGDAIRFVHYLEQRLEAAKETSLTQFDEIEHIGLYNKMNFYHQLPVKGADHVRFDASYMVDIDHYFMERSAGGSPELPTQKMPQEMREFIAALNNTKCPGRFEVGSIILSMDDVTRGKLRYGFTRMHSSRSQGGQPSWRMPFTAQSFGLSVTYVDDTHLQAELRKSAVQMDLGKCERWLVVQLKNESPCEILKIETILPGRFSEAELAQDRSYLEDKTANTIASEKPGRNDPCPCGSGKKFKKCHLLGVP